MGGMRAISAKDKKPISVPKLFSRRSSTSKLRVIRKSWTISIVKESAKPAKRLLYHLGCLKRKAKKTTRREDDGLPQVDIDDLMYR